MPTYGWYECRQRYAPSPMVKEFARCRRCLGCLRHQQYEWRLRMVLEAATNSVWPRFVTLTYAEEPPEERLKEDLQKFVRRLRRRGYPTRYFLVTERGKKNRRLHHHGIMWIHEADLLRAKELDALLQECWSLGFVKFGRLKKVAGIVYASKYIVKDMIRMQYSNRPVLGRAAIDLWERRVAQLHEIEKFKQIKDLPGFLTVHVLNTSMTVPIPERDVRRAVERMGVPYAPAEFLRVIYSGVPSGPLDFRAIQARMECDNELYSYVKKRGENDESRPPRHSLSERLRTEDNRASGGFGPTTASGRPAPPTCDRHWRVPLVAPASESTSPDIVSRALQKRVLRKASSENCD